VSRVMDMVECPSTSETIWDGHPWSGAGSQECAGGRVIRYWVGAPPLLEQRLLGAVVEIVGVHLVPGLRSKSTPAATIKAPADLPGGDLR
jgi:hypothetical protein